MSVDQRPVTFGALLRRFRLAAGLSQEALAERAGLSRRGIADLERGARSSPYGDTVRRLATALDLESVDRASLLSAGQRGGASAVTKSSTLPLEPSPLVGRERELSELQLLLKTAHLLTLTGAAGVGKTRLALQLARDAEPRFEQGAVFIDLAPVRDPLLLPQALAAALNVGEEANKTAIERVKDHLGSRQLLVVLDNCEHLLQSTASLADSLLRSCGGLRILATSREAMRIRGEIVWPVPALRAEEAQELFAVRARTAQASLNFSNADNTAISRICQRLDGMPLAIELAAARVPALGLSEIEARLGERLRLLSSGGRLESPRHQTLRAAIDWSYALLSDSERLLFERLSVFSGGWSLAALEPVCAWQGLHSDTILDTFTSLVEKSLVVVDHSVSQTRYRLLETIREYATERLAASQQLDEQRSRHGAHFRGVAESGGVIWGRGLPPAIVEAIRREHDNMRAALDNLLAIGDMDEGLALCYALTPFWLSQGYLKEGDDWFHRFLADAAEVHWETLARSLSAAARLAEYRGAFDEATALLERSLAISREHANPIQTARALFVLADVAEHRGDFDQACAYLHEGVPLGREAGLPDTVQALLTLSRIEDSRAETAQAAAHRDEALGISRRTGDNWSVAYVLNQLGAHARAAGQLRRAQTLLSEAQALWIDTGSRMGQRAALMNLVMVYAESGAITRSVPLAREMLGLCRDIRDASPTTARCLEIAAHVLCAAGSVDTAVLLVSSAAHHRHELGAPAPPGETAELEHLLHAARGVLSPAAFKKAYEDGDGLSIEGAVALASDYLASGDVATA